MGLAKPAWPVLQRENLLTRGLIHAWPFFERAGAKVRDYSGNPFDGTAQASPSWVGSPFGSALSFNGSSQYVKTIPASEITTPNTQLFSLSLVLLIGANGSGNGSHILGNRPGTGADAGIITRVLSAASTIELGYYDGASYKSSVTSSQPLNTWLNVVFTWDKTTPKIYINGKADWSPGNTGTPTGPLAGSPWTIGCEANGLAGSYFNGSIAHAAIWNRTLSAVEVTLFHFDPFAIYRPRSRWWEVPIGAAGPLIHWDAAALGAGITLTNSELTATRN